MKILLSGECQVAPGKLGSVTHFNGLPITATIITNQIHTSLLNRGQGLNQIHPVKEDDK